MSITRAGLRQTFFDHGQLRFSRLTPMATGMIGEVATGCATETRKIYQYLAGQRLISRDTPLQTLVLAHPSHFAIIGDRCQSTAERQVQMVDLLAEAKRSGLAETPTDSRADLLFLHLLAKRTPNEQFAPAVERRPYRLWQTRRAINALAAGIFAVSAFYGATQMMTHFELATTNSMLQSEVELGKRRYNNMLQGLPPVPISYDSLRTLTDRYEALSRRSPGPEPLFVHISRALNKSPKIELTRLDWSVADRPDAVPASAGNPAGAAAVAIPAGGNGFAVVRIQAQLPLSMASDHRTQLETVNAFAESLRGPDIEVHVLTFPFETESGKSIKSSEATSLVDPPRFALSMAGKL